VHILGSSCVPPEGSDAHAVGNETRVLQLTLGPHPEIIGAVTMVDCSWVVPRI